MLHGLKTPPISVTWSLFRKWIISQWKWSNSVPEDKMHFRQKQIIHALSTRQTFRATMLRCRKKVLVITAGFAAFLLKFNSEMLLANKAIRHRKIFSSLQNIKMAANLFIPSKKLQLTGLKRCFSYRATYLHLIELQKCLFCYNLFFEKFDTCITGGRKWPCIR